MSNNGYTLLRKWFDFSFENPDKVNIAHSGFYSYLIDRWNRFGQKDIFGIPTAVTMEATNIKSKNTYFSLLNDLERFGFIKIIQKSINQNTATVISLTSAVSKFKSALDTATIQQEYSGGDSTVPIDKQVNKETKKQIFGDFDSFWNMYPRKEGKAKAKTAYNKVTKEHDAIIQGLEKYILFWRHEKTETRYIVHPATFLNGRRWEDDIPINKQSMNQSYSPYDV